jgi:hypothetical protein
MWIEYNFYEKQYISSTSEGNNNGTGGTVQITTYEGLTSIANI